MKDYVVLCYILIMALKERLDVVFIRNRISSGRRVRRLLRTHDVLVNGEKIINSGFYIDTEKDEVLIDGKKVSLINEAYFIMNKAPGTVCTNASSDLLSVFNSIPAETAQIKGSTQLHTVGRLDMDTEGLLILTTNGDFSHYLTDPETHFPKTYEVLLEKKVSSEEQNKWKEKFSKGMDIPQEGKEKGFFARPSYVEFSDEEHCLITINEGKFHQVKRMVLCMENRVLNLKRISMGKLRLDPSILSGEFRKMTDEELELLMSSPHGVFGDKI